MDREWLSQVVAVLRAAGADASVYTNGQDHGVRVRTEDGGQAVWMPQADGWAYTLLDADGAAVQGEPGVIGPDSSADEVAGAILRSADG